MPKVVPVDDDHLLVASPPSGHLAPKGQRMRRLRGPVPDRRALSERRRRRGGRVVPLGGDDDDDVILVVRTETYQWAWKRLSTDRTSPVTAFCGSFQCVPCARSVVWKAAFAGINHLAETRESVSRSATLAIHRLKQQQQLFGRSRRSASFPFRLIKQGVMKSSSISEAGALILGRGRVET